MDSKKIISNTFGYLLQRFLFLFKQSNVLIGLPHARIYSDNSKYFFEYLIRKQVNLNFYLITKDKSIYKKLRKEFGERVVYSYSFKAIIVYLKSRFILVTHGKDDIFPFLPSKKYQVIINMWHGSPLKKIGRLVDQYKDWELDFFHYMIASTENEVPHFAKAFNIDPSIIKVFGQPRNDLLSIEVTSENKLRNHIKVLYTPTYRNYGSETLLFPFDDFNAIEFNDFLKENNIHLVLKSHINANEISSNSPISALAERITILDNKDPKLQERLQECDILVTDYSGIFFDFVNVDKPIVFIPFEFDSFLENPGFIYDYNETTPGFKVNSQKEFLAALDQYIKNPKTHSNERANIRNQFHKFQDDKSSERLLNFVTSLQ